MTGELSMTRYALAASVALIFSGMVVLILIMSDDPSSVLTTVTVVSSGLLVLYHILEG